GEDDEFAFARSGVDFSVGNHWRGPEVADGLIGPVGLPGLGVEAVEEAGAVGGENQAVVNRGRAAGFALEGMGPDLARGCDVAGLGGVDALEPAFVLAPP